jgi:hypothetical protein
VELLALVVVERAEEALVLLVGEPADPLDGDPAAVGEVDVLDAAVGVAAVALGEAEALEVVHEPDHRALVDPQQAAQRALGHRALGVDHREHGGVLGPDLLPRERLLEALSGSLGDEREHVAGPVRERVGERGCLDGRHPTDRTAPRSS